MGDLRAVLTGHGEIDDDEIRVEVRQRDERLGPRRAFPDGVADLRQDARHGAPDVVVVVDDEHAFGAWGGEGVLIVQDASRLGLRAPEPDPDDGALSDLAVDGDVAAQLMDDAEDLRQAQPRPLAGGVGERGRQVVFEALADLDGSAERLREQGRHALNEGVDVEGDRVELQAPGKR